MRLVTLFSRRRFGGALAGVAVLSAAGAPLFGPAGRAAGREPRTHRVLIRRFAFEPAELTIAAGDRVEWLNHDTAPHTASATDDSWDTGGLAKSERSTLTFPAPGRQAYVCAYHPAMHGTLTVTGT